MTITEKFNELKQTFNLKDVPQKVLDTFIEQLYAKMVADVSALGGNPFIIEENTKDIEEQNKIIAELENNLFTEDLEEEQKANDQKIKKAKEHLIEIEQNLKDVEKGEKQRIKFVNYYLEMINNFKTLTD